jgi:hypothetical protein
VPAIDIDARTLAHVRFAARVAGVSESAIVAQAVEAFVDAGVGQRDPWEPVPIFGEYGDEQVEALYVPVTRRVTITSGPLTGDRYGSPSGAARAVVLSVNPKRLATQTNGWRFWRLISNGDRLEVLRDPPKKKPRRPKF